MNRRFWLFAVGFLLLLAWRGKIIQGFEGFKKPGNFPEPVYDFKSNPVTQEGFELGRIEEAGPRPLAPSRHLSNRP